MQPAGQAPITPPLPHGVAPQPPSQVTLGDKVPEVALEGVWPTPELALRKISACPAWWAPSTAPPHGGGWVGDIPGAQVAEMPVHTPQTRT